MRYLAWNLLLASWLLVTAFFFTQTAASLWITLLCALLIGVFALLSRGKPALRMALSALALLLGGAALLLPELPGATRLNDGFVAALVFGLSVVPGRADLRLREKAAGPPEA